MNALTILIHMYLAGQGKWRRRARRSPDAGYAMAALLVGITIMAVMMTVAMPVWKQMVQREKEEELVFRGEQIAHSIGMFQRKFANAYPPSIDVLVEQKFLRKKYKDPDHERRLRAAHAGAGSRRVRREDRATAAAGSRRRRHGRPAAAAGRRANPFRRLARRSSQRRHHRRHQQEHERLPSGSTKAGPTTTSGRLSTRPAGAAGAGGPEPGSAAQPRTTRQGRIRARVGVSGTVPFLRAGRPSGAARTGARRTRSRAAIPTAAAAHHSRSQRGPGRGR